MRGIRVFVPEKLRKLVLDELHATHFGTTRMKSLARAYCWWPGIDRNIENIVQNCIYCQLTRPNPVEAPLYPWETPSTPASSCRLCRSIFRALFFHISERVLKMAESTYYENNTDGRDNQDLSQNFRNARFAANICV